MYTSKQIEQLQTWDELLEYLTERLDYATDEKSQANPSFSKEQMWNLYFDQCMKGAGQDLPSRTVTNLRDRIKKDFGMESPFSNHQSTHTR